MFYRVLTPWDPPPGGYTQFFGHFFTPFFRSFLFYSPSRPPRGLIQVNNDFPRCPRNSCTCFTRFWPRGTRCPRDIPWFFIIFQNVNKLCFAFFRLLKLNDEFQSTEIIDFGHILSSLNKKSMKNVFWSILISMSNFHISMIGIWIFHFFQVPVVEIWHI